MEGAENKGKKIKKKKKKRRKRGKKEGNRVRAFVLFVCLGNRQFCSVDDMEGCG